tara:strand:- start:1008 stop:2072 length:1065 start_codon:yes stop_codon:yes gene_type:complete
MSVQVKGSGTIGGLDEGLVVSGIVTSSTQINVGSNIKLGNAGVITATSFDGSTLTVNGDVTFTGANKNIIFDKSDDALEFNDNAKIVMGDSSELELFHSPNGHSYFQSTAGSLYIRTSGSNEIALQPAGSSENSIRAIGNGAVELYHDNTKRIETLSSGARVVNQLFVSEGTINLEKSGVHHHRILMNDTGNDLGFQQSADNGANTNFTTYLRINNGGNISLPVDSQVLNLGASQDMQLYHNGTDSYILNATGNFRIGQYNNANLKFFTSNSTRWEINGSGHFLPDANNSFDIGSTSLRVRNIYTNDLNLSNEGSTNNVDNTWGNYTIQEGESDLYLINNRNGKKYKFNLTEVS